MHRVNEKICFSLVSAVALDKLLEVEEISDTFEGMLKYVQKLKKKKGPAYMIHRGSYMSAHVLLNLLNTLGKRDEM